MAAPPPSTDKMTLEFKLLKGRNLAAKDLTGKSDPFVKWTVDGKKKSKSAVIKQNLNPEWNETYYWDGCSERTVIRGEVWDHDLLGKDFMGHFQIETADMMIAVREPVEKWITLQGKSSDKVSGDVLVRLSFREKPDANLTPDQLKAMAAAELGTPSAPSSAPNSTPNSAPNSQQLPPVPQQQPPSAIPPSFGQQPNGLGNSGVLEFPPSNTPPLPPKMPEPTPSNDAPAPPPPPPMHRPPPAVGTAPPPVPRDMPPNPHMPPPMPSQPPSLPPSLPPSQPPHMPPPMPSQPPSLPPSQPPHMPPPNPSSNDPRPLPPPPTASHKPQPHFVPHTAAPPHIPPPQHLPPQHQPPHMPPQGYVPPSRPLPSAPLPSTPAEPEPVMPSAPLPTPPLPTPPAAAPKQTVRSVFAYEAAKEGELSLVLGETYTVDKEEDGWYQGTSVSNGSFGWFPGNYVENV